jgi:hypothetical protein
MTDSNRRMGGSIWTVDTASDRSDALSLALSLALPFFGPASTWTCGAVSDAAVTIGSKLIVVVG